MKDSIGILANASYGSVIVPPDDSWELGIVFGNTAETDPETVEGWNTKKHSSSQVTGGVLLTDLKDLEDNDIDMEILIEGTTLESNPVPIAESLIPPYGNFFTTSYTFNPTSTITLSKLDDDEFYTIKLCGFSLTPTASLRYPNLHINDTEVYNYQAVDFDSNIKTNIIYPTFKNIKSIQGFIEIRVNLPDFPFYVFGIYVEQHREIKKEISFTQYPAGPSPVAYSARIPTTTTQNTPVIISLHPGQVEGNGTIRQLNNAYGGNIVKAFLDGTYNGPMDGVLIVAPQFYENVDNAPLLHSFIEYLVITYNVNPDNVYLMGFSAGMWNSLAYIGNQNHQVRAAVIGNQPYTGLDEPTAPSIETIASTFTPMWIFGGTADFVQPIELETFRDAILSYEPSYPIRLSIFEGGDHSYAGVSLYGKKETIFPVTTGSYPYNNGEIYDWLLSHTSSPRVFLVGGGDGNITIDGSILGDGLINGDIINIAPGIYNNLNIINIDIPIGYVTVKSEGSTRISVNHFEPKNVIGLRLENVNITSTGQNNISLNILPLKNITIVDSTFVGATNFSVRHGNLQPYNPENIDGTVIQNLVFERITWISPRQINLGGNTITDTGRLEGITFRKCIFRNVNGGLDFQDGEGSDGSIAQYQYIVNITNAYNYDFDGNYFYKIASLDNSIHRAMIYVQGVGVIRNNKAEKYYGQIARQGLYAKTPGQSSYAYNNIGIEGLRYSLLECQVFSNWEQNENWVAQDYHCHFNTAYNIGINESGIGWQAVIVDIYNLRGGNAFVHNNLAINVQPRISGGNSTNFFWGVEPAQYYTNMSFDTLEEANINPSTLIPWQDSPVRQNGTHIPYITLDQLENTRTNPPSVGALEPEGNEPAPEPLPSPNSPQNIYNVLLDTTQPIFLTNKPIDAQVEWRLNSNEGELISTSNPFTLSNDYTDEEGTFTIYVRYHRGATYSPTYVITINVLEEFPNINFEELVKLTIEIEGLPSNTNFSVIRNEEVQPNRIIHLPLNTEVTEVSLEPQNGYIFVPNHTVSVLMNQDRTVIFTAIPQ